MNKINHNGTVAKGQIKVLVVDDSALVRSMLKDIFQKDRRLKVIGIASDPFMAAKKIRRVVPDVITLDIEMPRMDGLTFLKKIMGQHPIPVVVISSLTARGTETGMKALEYGAVEIVTKPQLNVKGFVEESAIRICDAVVAAAGSKKGKILSQIQPLVAGKKNNADVILPHAKSSLTQTTEKIVVIGASTGGTEAIRDYLEGMPENGPGTVIVQHMPENFTRAFAKRMNDTCKMTVKEASNGDSVIPGHVLIAPGNHHLLLKRSGARYYVQVLEGPLVNRHRPSVDVLFRSAAICAGKNALGIIMTGMGDDGARGLLEMKEAGAYTIAQNEQSSVVFGMPKEAIERNATREVLPLSQMSGRVLGFLKIT